MKTFFLLLIMLDPNTASVIEADTKAQCIEAAQQIRKDDVENLKVFCVESEGVADETVGDLLKKKVQ